MTTPRALVVFAAGFYLNLPVLAAHNFHLPMAASAFALLLAGPCLMFLVAQRRPLVVTPALPLMIAYLTVLVISATLAGSSQRNAVTPIITFLSEGLLLYLLVTNAVRNPQHLRMVLWAVILAGAFMGLISVWQEATHAYGKSLGGLAQVDVTGFSVGGGLSEHVRPRLAGPIGEKNRYAQILLVLLPIAAYRVRAERQRNLRVLAGACVVLILAGMVLTYSRGAAVALGITLVTVTVLGLISLRKMLALLLMAAALIALFAPNYVQRLQSLAGTDSALSQSPAVDGAIQGRATENLAALYVFRDHPLFGVGPGQFFNRYSTDYGNELDMRFLKQNRRAHNLYLEIAADTGILGLAAFLAIVGATLVQLRRLGRFWRQRNPELAALADGMLVSLIAYMASAIFLQLAYQRYFWFLIALGNATIWISQTTATSASPAATNASGGTASSSLFERVGSGRGAATGTT